MVAVHLAVLLAGMTSWSSALAEGPEDYQTQIGVLWRPRYIPLDYPDVLKELGVTQMRFLLQTESEIPQLLNPKNAQEVENKRLFISRLKRMKELGIEVIISIRWHHPVPKPVYNYTRDSWVPKGQDRKECLDLLGRFLKEFGQYIDWYAVGLEVVVGGGKYSFDEKVPDATGKIPAVAWWIDLVEHTRKLGKTNPDISHIRFISPSFTTGGLLARLGGNFGEVNMGFQDALIDFANKYTDALDVHLHVPSTEDMARVVGFLKSRVTSPIVALEWSDARSGIKWLYQPSGSTWFGKGITNRDFIEKAIGKPVPLEVWNEFIKTAPHEEGFMEAQYKVLNDAGFLFALFADVQQYGNPHFNWNTLLLNNTVRITPSANKGRKWLKHEPYYSNFLKLTHRVNQARNRK